MPGAVAPDGHQAAPALGTSRKTLDILVDGRAGVSPEMAVRLVAAFAGSAPARITMHEQDGCGQVRQREDAMRATVKPVKPAGNTVPPQRL